MIATEGAAAALVLGRTVSPLIADAH